MCALCCTSTYRRASCCLNSGEARISLTAVSSSYRLVAHPLPLPKDRVVPRRAILLLQFSALRRWLTRRLLVEPVQGVEWRCLRWGGHPSRTPCLVLLRDV